MHLVARQGNIVSVGRVSCLHSQVYGSSYWVK